jgi:nucleoside-diphosphate-sugar epimerase
MKVLYIGGTGEISYDCVLAGTAAGQEITVYNRGVTGEPLPDGVRRVVGDRDDQAKLAALAAEGFDVVCQFLAYGMDVIERDMKAFAGKIGQYVFISSASAYKKPVYELPITEQTPLINPHWGYSRDKAAMEERLMELHRGGKCPVTIVRPSHTYRRHVPGTFVSGDDWAWRMLNGRKVIVHGDGTSLWVLTHSADFARPFIRLLGNDAAVGEAFHITADKAYPWDAIFAALGDALGVEPQIVHVPSDTLIRYDAGWEGPLHGDKSWSVLFDNSKARRVAGDFSCDTPLAEGMREVVEHYRRRAAGRKPDEKLHALLDRIAADQLAVG